MKYTKIDLEKWSRGKLFKFYTDEMRVVMSLTADVDVTRLLTFAKAGGIKFYPSMLWAVSKVINSRDEFKYGYDKEGSLIRWEYVSPSYVDFHKDKETFIKAVTEFSDDIFEFHRRFIKDRAERENSCGIEGEQPPNFFDVSCLPWIRYKHFDLHVFDEGRFLAPVVTWGRYVKDGGRYVMPLTMNIHHAVADGFHLSRFFSEVQDLIDSL